MLAAPALALLAGPLSAAQAAPSSSALLVVNSGYNNVEEFAPGASGDVGPVDLIAGSQTQLDHPSLAAYDPQGDIAVANDKSSTVTEYAPVNSLPVSVELSDSAELSVSVEAKDWFVSVSVASSVMSDVVAIE